MSMNVNKLARLESRKQYCHRGRKIEANRTKKQPIRIVCCHSKSRVEDYVIPLSKFNRSFPSLLQSTSEIGDDRVDGDEGGSDPKEADSCKFEDVSPSIKLPRTRERRPP